MSDAAKCTMQFNPADSGYEEWTSKFAESRDKCPVFWSESHGGYWATGSYAEVTDLASGRTIPYILQNAPCAVWVVREPMPEEPV